MRREQFTLEVTDIDWIDEEGEPSLPTLSVTAEDGATALLERASEPNDDASEAEHIDVTVRLYDSGDASDGNAVVAVTDRVTGEYMIEVNVEATEILSFVTAARRYGELTDDSARYRVRIGGDASDSHVVYEKRTLLVYSSEGELLRGNSLIPSGVEI